MRGVSTIVRCGAAISRIGCQNRAIIVILRDHTLKILAKAFWRIILPLIAALILATVRMLDLYGRSNGLGLTGGSLIVDGVIFLALIGVSFRNTLKWGKEAEDYEECLKEEEEIEKERRRRSSWRTR
jgi:hypothetical protein